MADDGDFSEDVGWADQTGAWRYAMFRGLGFEEWQSVVLAHDKADWHEAKGLLARGCSHEHAYKLVSAL